MENRAHAFIAGLFMLLLGASTVAALWWFGGKKEATSDYVVHTTTNISGLSQQAQVRYRGVRVGRVDAIEFDAQDMRRTLIHIRIRKDIPITRGTIARLGFQGVTGIGHVSLEDSGADATPLDGNDGAASIPMLGSQIQELTDVGGDTLRNAREFLSNANQLLVPENRQAIAKILSNLQDISENAKGATADLRQVLTPENLRLLHTTLVRAERASAEVGPFFSEARTLVARLQAVSDKLDTTLGDPVTGGVAALVPKFNELGSELSANSRQLSRVLQMLEDSPQSIIFGRHMNAPGPGEAGFARPDQPRRAAP